MNLRSFLGFIGLLVSYSSLASLEPKFNYDDLIHQKAAQNNYIAETPLTLTSDKFQMSSLLNGNNFVQGSNLLAAFNNRSISLVNITENNVLTIKEEFTAPELGLRENSINAVSLSLDDSRLYILSSFSDSETYLNHTNLYSYSINDTGMTQESVLEDVFNDYYYGLTLFSSNNSSRLMISNSYANQVKVVNIAESGALSISHVISTTRDIKFAAIDSINNLFTFVYDSYYSSTNNCLESFSLHQDGSKSLVDSIRCDSGEVPYRINAVEYNSTSGDLLIKGNNNFAIVNMDSVGELTSINMSLTQDVFATGYTQSLMLKDKSISFLTNNYPGTFEVYGYSDDGVISLESSTNLADLVGGSYYNYSVKNLKDDNFLFSNYNSEFGLVTLEQDNSLSSNGLVLLRDNLVIDQIGNLIISVKENLIVSISSQNLNLINTENSKQFKNVQSLALTRNDYNSSYEYVQLDDTSYLVFGSQRYIIFSFDSESNQITLITEANYSDTNNSSLRIGNYDGELQKAWVDGKYLVAKTSTDRISIFELVGTQLIFKEYLIDLTNGMNGIYQTTNLKAVDNHIFMLQNQTGYIYKLTIEDGLVSQALDPVYVNGFNGYGKWLTIGDKQLHFQNNFAMSFGVSDSEFELLTLSPISQNFNSVVALNDRHLLLSFYQYFEIYSVDQTTGALVFLNKISYADIGMPIVNADLYNVNFDGNALWYSASYYERTVGKLNVNRAPLWVAEKNVNLNLNEGATHLFSLADYIVDLDNNDAISFSEIDLPSSILLSADGNALEFDGSTETATQVMVSATDSKLEANFIFDLNYNFAPNLINPTNIYALNQNELITLNLMSGYEDYEGDNFSLAIDSHPSLDILSNGTLTGKFSEVGDISLTVNATDIKGATKTESILFNINGAPIVSGSTSITAKAGESLVFDLNDMFSDPETDTLIFSILGLPAGLTLSNNTITGKLADNGVYSAFVSAVDNKGAMSEAILTITVEKKSSGGGSFGFLLIILMMFFVASRRRPQASY